MFFALCRKIFQPRKSTKLNHLHSYDSYVSPCRIQYVPTDIHNFIFKYYLQKTIRNRYIRQNTFSILAINCMHTIPTYAIHIVIFTHRRAPQFNHFLVYTIYCNKTLNMLMNKKQCFIELCVVYIETYKIA